MSRFVTPIPDLQIAFFSRLHLESDMITDEDRRILDLFAARVRERFPNSRVLAYGSRARGDATWGSDFDICVILSKIDREAVEFDEETFLRQAKGRFPFVNNILNDAVAA